MGEFVEAKAMQKIPTLGNTIPKFITL